MPALTHGRTKNGFNSLPRTITYSQSKCANGKIQKALSCGSAIQSNRHNGGRKTSKTGLLEGKERRKKANSVVTGRSMAAKRAIQRRARGSGISVIEGLECSPCPVNGSSSSSGSSSSGSSSSSGGQIGIKVTVGSPTWTMKFVLYPVPLKFTIGTTYVFDQSDTSNQLHPLLFTEDRYINSTPTIVAVGGLTSVGVPGTYGAKVTFIPTSAMLGKIIYPYCTQHGVNMGNIYSNGFTIVN